MSGWLKLFRKITVADWYMEKPFDKAHAWIDLLMLAKYEDTFVFIRGKKIPVARGELVTSVRDLADRWGWSKDKVTRYLSQLELMEQIRQSANSLFSLIQIQNYSKYQDS